MADYFLVLNGDFFERDVRPPLAAGWRERSFGPCRELCAHLLPSARAYAARYHVAGNAPLLELVADHGLPFDRTYWRSLVGEVLLFTAVEIPEFQTCADTLCRLLAPGACETAAVPREELPPIRQAHEGSRDLTFGGAVYRPEYAGYNNTADVARLADYLGGIDPARWTVADLGQREGEGADDLADELDFAREWFPVLAALYRRCQEWGRVIVHESIY
jgi:hypothetical protein